MNYTTSTIAALLLALPAQADPDRISLLVGSHHVNSSYNFNEKNLGVLLTWENLEFDWTIGVYENSYSNTSVVATGYKSLSEWDTGELGFFFGAALYPETGRYQRVSLGDVVPIGGLQIRQGNFFTQVIPTFGFGVDAVVSYGVTFEME